MNYSSLWKKSSSISIFLIHFKIKAKEICAYFSTSSHKSYVVANTDTPVKTHGMTLPWSGEGEGFYCRYKRELE